jgi:hypothetical protein
MINLNDDADEWRNFIKSSVEPRDNELRNEWIGLLTDMRERIENRETFDENKFRGSLRLDFG